MVFSDCIVTERLILRPFVDEDKDDVFALMSDDYICKMAGIKPYKTVEEAENFTRLWRNESYAITERDNDKVIGVVQTPSYPWIGFAGLGYWLAEEYRGRGYMTEAIEAVKRELFMTWWCNEIVLFVYEDNPASRNLAIKCGFHLDCKRYQELAYSEYGRWVSKECFEMTKGDYEWERRGEDFYTTAEKKSAA